MFNKLQDPLALLGRIALALLFVPAGIGKVGDGFGLGYGFSGTAGAIASTMNLPGWLGQVGAVVAIFVEVGLGLALLLGYRARLSAFVLAVFTVAAAIFFHKFWGGGFLGELAQKAAGNQIHFYKNVAIAGGLLFVSAFGPGKFGVDRT